MASVRILYAIDNPVFLDMMKTNEDTLASIKKAIIEVTGVKYGLGPYNGPAPASKPEEKAPLEEVLQKARDAGVPVDVQ